MKNQGNCANCGAAMQFNVEHHYFFCLYCGGFEFPDKDTRAVTVLGRDPAGRLCPVCHQSLAAASLYRTLVHSCNHCRGLLIDRPAFAALVDHLRRTAAGPPVKPRPLDVSSMKREIDCPSCRKPMDTHPYYGPGNIVIDSCRTCDLIWLDYTELDRISDAPGGDRGVWKIGNPNWK